MYTLTISVRRTQIVEKVRWSLETPAMRIYGNDQEVRFKPLALVLFRAPFFILWYAWASWTMLRHCMYIRRTSARSIML